VTNLIIWDSEELPPSSNEVIVLWRGFSGGATPDMISIPSLIEKNAEAHKVRYLAWIYDLGETLIQGRRLVDHLELHPGISYWWMTLLVEKCNYAKSKQIDDAIRMMAFTDWVSENSLESVTLVGAGQGLADCMRLWCKKMGITFKWQRQPIYPLSLLRHAYQSLPLPLQALVGLFKYLIDQLPLRGVGLAEWQTTNGKITFFSYFLNLVPEAIKEGRYESLYWGTLPDALQADGRVTNWLHMYIKDPFSPSAIRAADTLKTLNRAGQGKQIHVTLITFLSFSTIFEALKDWCRLALKGWQLQSSISSKTSNGLDLWPLFETEWRQSTVGSTAMINAMTLSLFSAALNSLPRQQTGVYLQENQGWEFGLIQTWKAAGHGRLIGSPHSTVRFWDLRYFFDQRSYNRDASGFLPIPDQIAVNGKATTDAYLAGGYPEEDLAQVEALRYLYLDKLLIRQSKRIPILKKCFRLLVLGDYLSSCTLLQMHLLEKVAGSLPKGTIIIVKPHPACPVNPDSYPSLSMSVTMDPIDKLLSECDAAYTSAVTSAAVDAYCAGVPVISVSDPNMLNMSPLRGCEGVIFVKTPEELAQALTLGMLASTSAELRHTFFTIDKILPRWRALLTTNY
jgi:surface carbohydrate biosynthesis protein (TIGR04326 family)